jgi:uncharacterized membrane-anchored protein
MARERSPSPDDRRDLPRRRKSRDESSGSAACRSRQSLPLQHTVEGLSVAAVSYYVIGLVGYLFKALEKLHVLGVDPALATGLAVPVVIVAVFLTIRRIHKAYAPER